MKDFDSSKIADPQLRAFADIPKSDAEHSIIVELAAPPPEVSPHAKHRPLPVPPSHGRREPADLANIEGNAALMDQLEGELAALNLSRKPVRLDTAQAFVVGVTPAQLRAISRLPLAGIIRLNRTHYARAKS